jgi:hypothetical protein
MTKLAIALGVVGVTCIAWVMFANYGREDVW